MRYTQSLGHWLAYTHSHAAKKGGLHERSGKKKTCKALITEIYWQVTATCTSSSQVLTHPTPRSNHRTQSGDTRTQRVVGFLNCLCTSFWCPFCFVLFVCNFIFLFFSYNISERFMLPYRPPPPSASLCSASAPPAPLFALVSFLRWHYKLRR